MVNVPEGWIGLKYRGGALMPGYLEPGWNTNIPWLEEIKTVKVSMATDTLHEVPCGTKGGIHLSFTKVEAVY